MVEVQTVPISPVIGARIEGLNLTANPTQDEIRFLEQRLAEHLVLVIPEQNLEPAELASLVRYFGPLFEHHADEGVLYADGINTVLEMRKEPDGERLFGGSDWHADVTFRKPEGYLSFLISTVVPGLGGDTAFANTIASYNALSPGFKNLLRQLNAVHSYDGPLKPDHPSESVVHPVIRQHPLTGEEGLYINRMFATRFEGMTAEESRPLIEFLDRHMTQPQFTCRISWEVNQLVIWDNRFTLHYPINDFTGEARLLYRCTALVTP